ncbi:thiamine diphosphokinase [Cognatiyoonia sp. IB215446]|uniref:thiamine diphosphokinase n=1 Tax=Cognatiyoonia sp. IB215446 TaxID=3097355 RepID=UPI002A153CFB|nr:thiamine diphosphokinase [Cognatiyoonia sp. IB215446]MDX8348284.1 thiamine diphosphokinase [Cognatiyoonia sp. IB215446]
MISDIIVSSDSPVCFVGGGDIGNASLAADFPSVSGFVGVDGGADHLLAARISPVAVIGDFDSLSDRARATFSDILCHVAEQETTDFEKALMRVAAPSIYAVGFTGGRIDHTLGVLNVMARYADRRVLLVDDEDVSLVVANSLEGLVLPEGTRISLMPLDKATVSATGLRWPLDEFAMHPAGRTSGSNAATGGPISIQTNGPLLVTLPRAHLGSAVTAIAHAR